jgi:hypothetical protein
MVKHVGLGFKASLAMILIAAKSFKASSIPKYHNSLNSRKTWLEPVLIDEAVSGG